MVADGYVHPSAHVSALRDRCPDCRTLTAVAIGPD
jgi:hypothetical protein